MRFTGMIAGVVLAGTGCSGDPGVDGDATITLIGSFGQRYEGFPVYATAGSAQLASAVTDSSGTATIGVAADSAVTYYAARPDPTSSTGEALVSSTLFGIDPGIAAQFPVFAASDDNRTTVLVTANGIDFGGATEVELAGGWACGAAFGTVETVLEAPAGCAQTDGATTLTALLFDDAGVVLAYAVGADNTSGGGTLTLADLAAAPSTVVDTDFTELPDVPGAVLDAEVYFRRKGQGFGPVWALRGAAPTPTVHFDAALVEESLADGLYQSVSLSAERMFVHAEQAVDGTAAISLDGSQIAAPPVAVSVALEDGVPVVTIDDPGPGAGYSTYVQVSWIGPDGVVHVWDAWAAGPDAAGPRRLAMPPVPEDIAEYLPPSDVSLVAHAGYNQADFAPADYRLQPEPLVPYAFPAGMRSYAIRAAD